MDKLQWHNEKRRVSDLIPLNFNPRKRNEKKQKKLIDSVNEFDLVEIPVINTDNRIIAGQRRYEALIYSGRENDLIDVRVPNRMLTDDEVKRYNLISNTHAGEWDLLKLEEYFSNIPFRDIIDLPPIEIAPLPSTDSIIQKPKEIVEDEFNDEPSVIEHTSLGDIYELNQHRVMCGDSTDPQAVSTLMNGVKAMMIFTDPPYNVKVNSIVGLGKTKHDEFAMASGEMNKARFTRFLEDIFLNLIKFSQPGSIHYICMDWKHVNELTTAGKIYTEQKQLIVWKKNNGGMGTFYRSQHELIFVYKNGRAKHINNFGLGETGRYRTNVWEYDGMNTFGNKERESLDDHPTVKPVKLVADAIIDCSNLYDSILDLFLGSGTTLLASEQTDRICYGMELEPKYCDLSIRRWLRWMKQKGLSFTVKKNGIELTEDELKLYEQ
jgi:DNA modification methylase